MCGINNNIMKAYCDIILVTVCSNVDRWLSQRNINIVATAWTLVAIKKLVANSVATALEAQAATMANANNTNRNTGERKAPIARNYSYKSSCSCNLATQTVQKECFGLSAG
ncbi:hypothetical protein Tco_0626380 [Tanacetum coccineum]|uniref:Uncharacterized protein n=1 Tax=Tanacetum coccineum TaxID=301880 RepID=A0ABQ4WJN8_9ASTR